MIWSKLCGNSLCCLPNPCWTHFLFLTNAIKKSELSPPSQPPISETVGPAWINHQKWFPWAYPSLCVNNYSIKVPQLWRPLLLISKLFYWPEQRCFKQPWPLSCTGELMQVLKGCSPSTEQEVASGHNIPQ